jgi:hypothetical protein
VCVRERVRERWRESKMMGGGEGFIDSFFFN